MKIPGPTRRERLVSLLQNLMFAQHVSGTIMSIIRSSRVIQMVAACATWRFGLQVVGLVWNCGLCVRLRDPDPIMMMGIMVAETCWANSKFCNKKPICCIQLAFNFHVLTTMHGQTNIKFTLCLFLWLLCKCAVATCLKVLLYVYIYIYILYLYLFHNWLWSPKASN